MSKDYNESLDSQLCEIENPNKKKDKNLLKVNWAAIGLVLMGVLFKTLHWPFADVLLLIGALLILVVGVLRFYFASQKSSQVVVQLLVNIFVVFWIISTLFYFPFRSELKYITIAVILIRTFFFRKTQDN